MTGVLTSIFEVFSSVSSWIVEAVVGVIPMFYSAETGLTFVGVLAVAGLAMSVAFLLGVWQAEKQFSCKKTV